MTGQGKHPRRLLLRLFLGTAAFFVLLLGGFRLWQHLVLPADAPVVGVCFDTAWHGRAGLSTKLYELALSRAGARLFVLSPEVDRPEEVLARAHGLLIAGGADVDPTWYGGATDPDAVTDPARDRFEIPLVREAFARNMPVLGICRGIQVINVALGGSLINLRSNPKRYELHGITAHSFDAHEVKILRRTHLARLIGHGTRRANSFHGQAVGRLGKGLRVCARAEDGITEGIEAPTRRFFMGVQWHPEMPPQQSAIFKDFARAARRYRTARKKGASVKPEPTNK